MTFTRGTSRGMRAAGCALAVILLATAACAEVADLSAFGRLPVQAGGRVMPVDSHARHLLLQFSGRSSHQREPAVNWLARVVFAPEAAATQKVFLVNHPEVLEALDVKPDGRRYSFAQLRDTSEKLRALAEAAQQHEEDDRSPVEKEFLRLYANLAAYAQLTFSFQFALPHPDFAVSNAAVRARLQMPDDAAPPSFLDVYQRAQGFSAEVQALAGTKPETWNDEQAELFRLSSALFQWSQFYRGLPIALLPMQAHGQEQWVSPWDLLGFGFLDDASRREIGWLQDLARAYGSSRQVDFNLAAHNLERSVVARAQPSRGLTHLKTELLYNRLQPFYRAKLFYGLAFLVCLVGMMGRGGARDSVTGAPWLVGSDRSPITVHRSPSFLRRAAVVGVLLALVPHTAGIVWRMMIMGRPPMTNLYATFLFVAWIAVLLGLAIEWFQRNSLGTLLASAGGLALLMVSARFADQGDTMGVVVAVLDSNFWLSTHVVTITMGYAGCMAAGLAGHVYLLQAIRRPEDDPGLRATAGAVYGLTAFGLIFSFLGTMLGGVWADQSWGRFWGWDPKENGALLIVLWCSILFHARVARMIGPRGFAVGAVLGVIVVLMAWIGINLLGVGLHSYGFTSGLARGLALSIVFEVLFVLVTYPLAKKSGDIPGPKSQVPG